MGRKRTSAGDSQPPASDSAEGNADNMASRSAETLPPSPMVDENEELEPEDESEESADEPEPEPVKPAKSTKKSKASADEGPSQPPLVEYETMANLSTGMGMIEPGKRIKLDDEEARHWLKLGAVKRVL